MPSTCTIRLDAANLDHTAEFWQSLLGYEETARTGSGTPMERRTLVSEAVPGVTIELVACLPRPVIGSTLGSLRSLRFTVRDPLGAAQQAKHTQWIQPVDPAAPPPPSITLLDPSGYRVELARA